MHDATAGNLLTGLSRAIEEGDAVRARRRLGELNQVVSRLPLAALAPIRDRLLTLLSEAEALKAGLGSSLQVRPRQRRSVDAYRSLAGKG